VAVEQPGTRVVGAEGDHDETISRQQDHISTGRIVVFWIEI
jgi:hypothetical protein